LLGVGRNGAAPLQPPCRPEKYIRKRYASNKDRQSVEGEEREDETEGEEDDKSMKRTRMREGRLV
jgi:hypothetical protein